MNKNKRLLPMEESLTNAAVEFQLQRSINNLCTEDKLVFLEKPIRGTTNHHKPKIKKNHLKHVHNYNSAKRI